MMTLCSSGPQPVGTGNPEEPLSEIIAHLNDRFGIRPQLQELMIWIMADNDALVIRCLNNFDYQEIVFTCLLGAIFDAVEPQQPLPATAHAPAAAAGEI